MNVSTCTPVQLRLIEGRFLYNVLNSLKKSKGDMVKY